MSIFEYNARLHEETLKKEGYEGGRAKGREEGLKEGLKEGREKGREEGLKEGRFDELCSLVNDGILTIEQVSDRMGMEPEEFLKKKEQELMQV